MYALEILRVSDRSIITVISASRSASWVFDSLVLVTVVISEPIFTV